MLARKINLAAIALFLSFTLAVLGYQNCSRAKFAADSTILNSLSGGDAPGRTSGDDGQRPDGNNDPDGSGDDGNTPKEACVPTDPAPANRPRIALCAEATTVRFMAGQHFDVGDISVAAKDNVLYIQISMLNTLAMSESHVDLAADPELLQIDPGQFRYKQSYNNPKVTRAIYEIPFSDLDLSLGQTIYARVHGVVGPKDGQAGQLLCSQETAWAQGIKDGIGWSMYFPIKIAECP